MIQRAAHNTLLDLAKQFKAVAIVGPRQSGKTTLAKYTFPGKPYASLENPDLRRYALEDPRGFLSQFPQGAVLDEVQRAPELFSYLQQILDENKETGQYILTGSNNFLLQENISQSLAGRIAYLVLLPFALSELMGKQELNLSGVLYNGLYPPVYDQPVTPEKWYPNYLRTYVERDVRQVKNITDLVTFEKFLRLCAGRTGQLLNMSSLAIETGVDSKTIAAWISVLESSFILYRLTPHHRNFNKRVVKMPKLYFYDTGLVCSLLGINDPDKMHLHPQAGSIFENYVITEMMKTRLNKAKDHGLFFWRDSKGHEIDVVIERSSGIYPVEIKYGKTVIKEFFRNIKYFLDISGQEKAAVIYGGDTYQKRSTGIEILPWNRIGEMQALI